LNTTVNIAFTLNQSLNSRERDTTTEWNASARRQKPALFYLFIYYFTQICSINHRLSEPIRLPSWTFEIFSSHMTSFIMLRLFSH